MVTELSEATFNDFIASNKFVLIDCWAPWCGPCRRMGPIIDELAVDLEGKVAVAKMNTDENQMLAGQLGINAIPALLIYKDGVPVAPLVGLRPKEDIISYLESL